MVVLYVSSVCSRHVGNHNKSAMSEERTMVIVITNQGMLLALRSVN
nr:MAG TPA_asm: hypothetical protein [Caudoviricetes sp.]